MVDLPPKKITINNEAIKTSNKVYHSSAFKTVVISNLSITVILANLNNTMQTKQLATRKPHSYLNRKKIYFGLFFVVEGSLAENI